MTNICSTMRAKTACACLAITGLFAGIGVAAADDAAGAGALYVDGPYAAVLAHYGYVDDEPLDQGLGLSLAGGVRRGLMAIELSARYTEADAATLIGGSVNALLFPFERLPGLFALFGAGAVNVDGYPGIGGLDFDITTVDGGVGYLWPLRFGSRHLGLRTQLVYQYGKRQPRAQEQNPPQADLAVPDRFSGALASIGVVFPLGRVPEPPPPPAPVVVVPIGDGDGDGVKDDVDQCLATPAGSSVNAQGCNLPPPCTKITDAAVPVSLGGCVAGDAIVLRGVNFEFDEARLTTNATTILDGVAAELKRYPEIKVELSGHTDARGADGYNQRLSERRAAAVVAYLEAQGVEAGRMSAAGHGETLPMADNDSDEGRELNRRVELKITERAATAAPAANADAALPSETGMPPTAVP